MRERGGDADKVSISQRKCLFGIKDSMKAEKQNTLADCLDFFGKLCLWGEEVGSCH